MWEVIATFKSVNEDRERLRASYEWLSDRQLSAALAYYDIYPREIDARLEREEHWTPERAWSEYPFMRPGTSTSDESA